MIKSILIFFGLAEPEFDTLKFWQQVQHEFHASNVVYLCVSKLFKKSWKMPCQRGVIFQRANAFLKSTNNTEFITDINSSIPVYVLPLFKSLDELYVPEPIRKEVRIEFIQWNIDRLQNK